VVFFGMLFPVWLLVQVVEFAISEWSPLRSRLVHYDQGVLGQSSKRAAYPHGRA